MVFITWTRRNLTILFYVSLLLLTFGTIGWTCYHYPLFPLQPDSLDWSKTWLMATVVDYYGVCLCLCGIILSSEPTWMRGIAWTAGCCLLGSPMACLWVLSRLVVQQADDDNNNNYHQGSLRLIMTKNTNNNINEPTGEQRGLFSEQQQHNHHEYYPSSASSAAAAAEGFMIPK